MSTCIACQADKVLLLSDFGLQPICHHFFDGGDPEGSHLMVFGYCEECGVAQLVNPIPPDKLIPRVDWISYNEPENHLDDMVEMIRSLHGITLESSIAGLSEKDDSTLHRFRELGFQHTWRLDPTTDLDIQNPNAGIETIQSLIHPPLSIRLKEKYGRPNVVIVRHMIENTQDTSSFLETFRLLLGPKDYVVFELSECARGLDHLDYTTLWEDHSLYFVEPTLISTLERHGFSVVKFLRYPAAYENCLVVVAQPKTQFELYLTPAELLREESNRVGKFSSGFQKRKCELRSLLGEWRRKGRIVLFGAGHHSAMFLNLFDFSDLIDVVVDDNRHKCGLQMPGSRVPIVGSDILLEQDVKYCLLSLSAESEKRVVQKHMDFVDRGGLFASIFTVKEGTLLNPVYPSRER